MPFLWGLLGVLIGRFDKSGNKKEISPEREEQVKQFIQDNLVEDSKEVQRYIQDEFNIFYKESTASFITTIQSHPKTIQE